jgi:hypothetical protein
VSPASTLSGASVLLDRVIPLGSSRIQQKYIRPGVAITARPGQNYPKCVWQRWPGVLANAPGRGRVDVDSYLSPPFDIVVEAAGAIAGLVDVEAKHEAAVHVIGEVS